ncbi:MAG: hypothetical protein RLZ12_883, partial [Bacillota bacterium]
MSFFRFLFQRILFDQAAQLSYYFLISLFPFLVALVTLFGYFDISSENLLTELKNFVPIGTYYFLEQNLSEILGERHDAVLSLSLLVTFYLASLGFRSIIRTFDTAYGVLKARSVWREVLVGFFLMLGLMLIFLMSILFSVIGKPISSYLYSLGQYGVISYFIGRWVFSSLILFYIFIFLYFLAPNKRISFKQALPGAVVAT